jgi:hypothetical protein
VVGDPYISIQPHLDFHRVLQNHLPMVMKYYLEEWERPTSSILPLPLWCSAKPLAQLGTLHHNIAMHITESNRHNNNNNNKSFSRPYS